HTEGGFGPASRNRRSLGRHPGLDPPPTRPRRTGRVPAHAARHQWPGEALRGGEETEGERVKRGSLIASTEAGPISHRGCAR
ncbi:unnamed protein product, partial [Tetraodon nigroviridis]